MNWEILSIVIIAVLFFLFIYVENKDTKYTTITIGNKTLKAEIADTYFKRMRGLMFRTEPPEAMIFVNPFSSKSGIWMRNMKFPIDIIWANDEILDIKENAEPCKGFMCPIYYPKSSSRYVIEVPANWTKENKINIGAKLKIQDI